MLPALPDSQYVALGVSAKAQRMEKGKVPLRFWFFMLCYVGKHGGRVSKWWEASCEISWLLCKAVCLHLHAESQLMLVWQQKCWVFSAHWWLRLLVNACNLGFCGCLVCECPYIWVTLIHWLLLAFQSGSYDLNPDTMRTFKGNNPSRYSYLVQGYENPYYLPGDGKKDWRASGPAVH